VGVDKRAELDGDRSESRCFSAYAVGGRFHQRDFKSNHRSQPAVPQLYDYRDERLWCDYRDNGFSGIFGKSAPDRSTRESESKHICDSDSEPKPKYQYLQCSRNHGWLHERSLYAWKQVSFTARKRSWWRDLRSRICLLRGRWPQSKPKPEPESKPISVGGMLLLL
jgi:hypothetical protein